jgi:hypothetical protein
MTIAVLKASYNSYKRKRELHASGSNPRQVALYRQTAVLVIGWSNTSGADVNNPERISIYTGAMHCRAIFVVFISHSAYFVKRQHLGVDPFIQSSAKRRTGKEKSKHPNLSDNSAGKTRTELKPAFI